MDAKENKDKIIFFMLKVELNEYYQDINLLSKENRVAG